MLRILVSELFLVSFFLFVYADRHIALKLYSRDILPYHTVAFRGRRGRDRMVVGFTTTYPISVYHH